MSLFIKLEIDQEKCLGLAKCGKCVKVCPVKATWQEDGWVDNAFASAGSSTTDAASEWQLLHNDDNIFVGNLLGDLVKIEYIVKPQPD